MRHLANAQYCADRNSNSPLDRVLTYKNLLYLLNLQFSSQTMKALFPEVADLLLCPLTKVRDLLDVGPLHFCHHCKNFLKQLKSASTFSYQTWYTC